MTIVRDPVQVQLDSLGVRLKEPRLQRGWTMSLAGKTYDLEPGDAAHFGSRLPHRLIARGSHPAEVILVASPFSETGSVTPISLKQKRAIPTMTSVRQTDRR